MSTNYETFGKYILLEKLAMGGMAEIYLARNSGASGVSKFVAIKRILPQFTEQTEFIDMFKDEAKIAVNLSHANVVGIYEFGIEKNAFFLAMDYIEGRNLRQILNKMKKGAISFSTEQVLYVIKEVAAGLDHAHRCIDANTGKPLNIIHRDMSPQNVMISFEGEVKIVDFGIAKAESQLETTRAGTLKGKFGYMSPEQAEGQNVDLRTDVFALGIVLWELLANDRLFVANNEVNTLRKIRDCQIPSLRKINPNIPPELERIVSKALAKDRNLRYQTSAAFHRELSRFLNRQYPDFSPQDFSVFIKTLFANEILESRRKMVEYSRVEANNGNQPAQANPVFDKTMVTNTETVTENTPDPVKQDFGNKTHEDKRVDRKSPPPHTLSRKTNLNANVQDLQPNRVSSDSSSLAVERNGYRQDSMTNSTSGVREGSVGGTRSFSRSQSRTAGLSSAVSLFALLLFLGVLAGGVAYYYSNPVRAMKQTSEVLAAVGLYTPPEIQPAPVLTVTTVSSVRQKFPVSITSNVSGAEILVDGRPSGDVTPATIEVEENKSIAITVQSEGFIPYSEKIEIKGPKSINATLKSDKKGFLNVIVRGEGQIWINSKFVQATSPAKLISVPAGEDVIVVAFDPQTQATDSVKLVVAQGETRTVQLSPRLPTQPQPQTQPKSQKQ